MFALGVVLLLLELLVIPGFGIAGFGGLALMFVSVLLSLLALDLQVSWDLGFVNEALVTVSTAIIITGVGGFLMARLLPATGLTRRMVLADALGTEEGFVSHDEKEQGLYPLGTEGVAETDLRPAGKIRIDGKRVDAVSEGEFISQGRSVRIVAWRSGNPVVREQP